MKVITLVFYGVDGSAAKDAANKIRTETSGPALVRAAPAFEGSQEPCSRVVLMPCVSGQDAKRLAAVYGDRVVKAGVSLPPPPPPPPFDPLASLAPNWRNRNDLRELAASVSGGRSVENKTQAIEVIEAALKARAKA